MCFDAATQSAQLTFIVYHNDAGQVTLAVHLSAPTYTLASPAATATSVGTPLIVAAHHISAFVRLISRITGPDFIAADVGKLSCVLSLCVGLI